MNPIPRASLLAAYPVLAGLPMSDVDSVLAQHARHLCAPAGAMLFDEGSPCQGFPMLLSGSVRVARGSPGGRRLELYRIAPGELCVVSTACAFGSLALSAHGQALAVTDLVLLSPAGLDRWCQHAAFRAFVFGVFGDRLADLMALAEAVAFQKLDQRLAQALLGHGAWGEPAHHPSGTGRRPGHGARDGLAPAEPFRACRLGAPVARTHRGAGRYGLARAGVR